MLTVVLSAYNEEKDIEACVDCIQRNSHFDTIHLVDDCSSDRTPYLISRLSSKYNNIIPHFNRANLGAVNSLWSVAQGLSSGFVLFASASDRLLPSLSITAYSDLCKYQEVGLWTAKSAYYNTLPSFEDSQIDPDVPESSFSSVLSAYEASVRYIRMGKAFEGSCSLYSIQLVKKYGLDHRLSGFADLVLGIQCLCHSGQIINKRCQSLVQLNPIGVGYLESTYKLLSLDSVQEYLDESNIRFKISCPNSPLMHKQYEQCLQVARTLIAYGFLKRNSKFRVSLLKDQLLLMKLGMIQVNRLKSRFC